MSKIIHMRRYLSIEQLDVIGKWQMNELALLNFVPFCVKRFRQVSTCTCWQMFFQLYLSSIFPGLNQNAPRSSMMTPATSSKQNGWKGNSRSVVETYLSKKRAQTKLRASRKIVLLLRAHFLHCRTDSTKGALKHEGSWRSSTASIRRSHQQSWVAPCANLGASCLRWRKGAIKICGCKGRVLLEAVGLRNERPALVAHLCSQDSAAQSHCGHLFAQGTIESGLGAAIDVDCTTLMGLAVISRAILKDLLAKHLVCQIPPL